MKVIGIVNSQGEYEGRKYHNLVFQVNAENTNSNKDVCGLIADVVKVRYADLNLLLGLGLADDSDVEKLKASDFEDFLNCEIDVSYNKYGAVQSIKKISEPPKSEPPKVDTKQGGAPVSK